DIHFEAAKGLPILSALLVRSKNRPDKVWNLVWSDEFERNGFPDAERWNIEEWAPRKVNDEDQAYTARAKNVRVEDGNLVIEAYKEDYEGARYTSGRIQSSGKGDYRYGRFEVRAKLPGGRGTWPAIWMLPSDPYKYSSTCEESEGWQGSQTCNAWPNSGEIDIMEHVGYQMGHIHGTVHNEAYYWVKWEQRKGRILIDGVDKDFHVYAMEWTPERIDIFVDDSLYFTYVNENSGWQVWPYDQPFHLVLNIAVGGWWGRSGGGIDDEIFPQSMQVDYARIYQQAP
ncbi:MAG: glycoside hydrolase family 16 protein, partial [Woeseiaceae bacterium]|nr:glycoside hydrolase family 16 protein [Woeseiaceae bacterium]